ncbi:alpha/beta hydrolase [Corynebacterium uterequi]|uniref:Alpha/beta hydrolase n=1 Tax=Corynebacterium uterequi TaxID=1072256 RepID=A0A0G3HF62_9CORY|nr:alpha/beta hydrolase [Corynebacterium uterequi]AKK11944.1 Alpha/beta hydrolase [Corynebacterium uterequi]
MSVALDPQQLRAAAEALRLYGAALRRERDAAEEELAAVLIDASGPAIDAFRHTFADHERLLDDLMEQVDRVRDTLEKVIPLADWLTSIIQWLQPIADFDPVAREAARAFAFLGERLDKACADEILRQCTPALGPPRTTLGEQSGATLDDIYAANTVDLSADLAGLLDRHPDLHLLEVYDGGFVGVVGDLESADTVTTFIAGVGSAKPQDWDGHVNKTRDLSHALGPRSAGVVWLGYRAPKTVLWGMQREPAKVGGHELARFQRELADRYPEQRRIVVGHSYGTDVASRAALSGLYADDLVLIGSPGVPAKDVTEFRLYSDAPRVHAVTSEGDAIGLATSRHGGAQGVDPASAEFGALVWDTPYDGDHSDYFYSEEFRAAYRDHLLRREGVGAN